MIRIENLNHTYKNRKEGAIRNLSLHIKKKESLVIIGSSGSGKSTLFDCISRLIEPTSGRIYVEGEDILSYPIKKARKIRGNIGMVFQNFNLIERDSVLKNVLNGRLKYNTSFQTIFGRFSKEDYDIARDSIRCVELEEYENERVANLSGGQKQRVAIARTLAQKSKIILADEPVSNLDPKLMKEILDLLNKICIEKEITLITSLHFIELAKKYASRIIGMKEGKIVFDGKPEELTEENIIDIYGATGF